MYAEAQIIFELNNSANFIRMRNTTMLKAILMKYTMHIEMDDNEHFTLKLTDKQSQVSSIISATNYSSLIRKAYSYLVQDLKNLEQGL